MASIELPDELLQRVHEEAALTGKSEAEYIVKAITDRLLHDHDKRLGIAKPAR